MKTTDRRSGAGGKLARSETVTIRLDPRLRYLAELSSRVQRRTLSSFIEWAINQSFERVELPQTQQSILDLAGALWDVDEPDRFARLATRFPDLLTHEEQQRWKLVRENGAVWHGRFADTPSGRTYVWDPSEFGALDLKALREHWAAFVAVAASEADASILPRWRTIDPAKSNYDNVADAVDAELDNEEFGRGHR